MAVSLRGDKNGGMRANSSQVMCLSAAVFIRVDYQCAEREIILIITEQSVILLLVIYM